MDRLLLSLCLIFLSLAAGHAAQHLLRMPRPRLESVRKRLQSFAVFCLIPCSAMLSLWGLPSPDTRLLALPFLGIVSWIWGGLLSRIVKGGFDTQEALARMDEKTLGEYCRFGNGAGSACAAFPGGIPALQDEESILRCMESTPLLETDDADL